MKKYLILLIGLLLIGILSFFCFQDKAGGIKENLKSKIESAYAVKQMQWVQADIQGTALESTRIAVLNGTAPSEALKAEAQRIALTQEGVSSVENRLIVVKSSEDAVVEQEAPIATVEVERKPEQIPIINVEVVNKPEQIPIIDVVSPKIVQKESEKTADLCQENLQKALLGKKITFAHNKTNIEEESHKLLDNVAEVIQKCPKVVLTITGHTDSDGSENYNKRLSSKRVASVKAYLLEKGVAPKEIKSIGYGASKPIADNTTPEGKAKNRRIEFNVKGVK